MTYQGRHHGHRDRRSRTRELERVRWHHRPARRRAGLGHLLSSATATDNPSTITGGINFQGKDIDLINATVSGGKKINCPGNTFSGSITLSNSNRVEIEGNFVGGSISISNSTLIEVAGNTVKGSIKCTNVTTATDGDATPNIVGGSNNC